MYLQNPNCIDLYKWNLENPKGFNCRMHSIMLNELLLAAGIESRFVTCLPEDTDDPDCHVVNIVWLPELNKWAMIDSDMAEYVSKKYVISLAELNDIMISLSKDNYLDFVVSDSKKGYYYCVNLKYKGLTFQKDLKKEKQVVFMLIFRTLLLSVLSFVFGLILKIIFKG